MFNHKLLNLCMIRSGIKNRELAELCGVTVVTISLWRNGKANPVIENVAKIAFVFNVDQVKFLKGVSE